MMTKDVLDAIRASARSIVKYHTEQARYGGASRDLHTYAESLLGYDVPALLDEVERLRAEKAAILAHLRDKAQRCARHMEDHDTAADMLRDAVDEIERGEHIDAGGER